MIINLAARYAAAFGAIAVGKLLSTTVLVKENNQYDIEVSEGKNNENTPTEDNKYDVNVYDAYDTEAEVISFKYDGKELKFGEMLTGDNANIYAPPLMMTFSRGKNLIVNEELAGDDIVVERWGTKPWSIDIRGVLIDVENRQYPKDKINLLARFFEYNNVIKVVGEQFYDKDIDSIYLTAVSITPVEGFKDTMQFNLSARSIKAVNYTLLKPL